MAKTSVTANIDLAKLGDLADAARDEIARTLGFELLRRSTQNVKEMKAVDTGNLRASGHVLFDGDPPRTPEVPPAEAGEAVVGFGAVYARAVHEGLGSNSRIGPRPFLYQAAEDLQADATRIAEDIVRRRFGS